MFRAVRFFVLASVCLVFLSSVNAQKKQTDTLQVKRLNPAKAALYSAICPGLGQIYNHKIWKATLVYVGFAGITAGYIYNQRELNSYQKAVDVRFDTAAATVDTHYPDLSDGTVLSLRNYHRRNRDICILAFVGLYALNIIDANVDAHLQEFSINKDLSLRWDPYVDLATASRLRPGIHLTLTF